MLRIVLINLLLFMLPFLLYALYAWFMRGEASAGGVLDDAPIAWLLIAGAVIVLGAIGYFISFEGMPAKGTYHAPTVKDGKVVPGYVD